MFKFSLYVFVAGNDEENYVKFFITDEIPKAREDAILNFFKEEGIRDMDERYPNFVFGDNYVIHHLLTRYPNEYESNFGKPQILKDFLDKLFRVDMAMFLKSLIEQFAYTYPLPKSIIIQKDGEFDKSLQ